MNVVPSDKETDLKTIWRVEDEFGNGVYGNADNIKIVGCHSVTRPIPEKDEGIDRSQRIREICGFKSKRQAFNWFSRKELFLLAKIGFRLKKINVSEITAVGEHQILAIR